MSWKRPGITPYYTTTRTKRLSLAAFCLAALVLATPAWGRSPIADRAGRLAAEDIVSSMDVPSLLGQTLILARHYEEGEPVRRLSPAFEEQMLAVRPGGVILYGVNFDTVEQVTSFVTDLQATSTLPLMVAVDQEGGLVNRLDDSENFGATTIPSASAVGRAGSLELAYEVGRLIGRELRALGIVVSFGPVADVFSPSLHETRFFSTEPDTTGTFAAEVVRGTQAEDVAAVVKHFPGLGGAADDTHHDLPVVEDPLEVVMGRDIAPFVTTFQAGAAGVMTGHVSVPALDESGDPATVSAPILSDLLRDELDFDGLVVTDALGMGGVAGSLTEAEAAVRALAAGADMLLTPGRPLSLIEHLEAAVEAGDLDVEVLRDRVQRIIYTKIRLGLFSDPLILNPSAEAASAIIGSEEHWAITNAVYEAARNGGVGE